MNTSSLQRTLNIDASVSNPNRSRLSHQRAFADEASPPSWRACGWAGWASTVWTTGRREGLKMLPVDVDQRTQFLSEAWIEEARRFLSNRAPTARFSLCETFSEPPPGI